MKQPTDIKDRIIAAFDQFSERTTHPRRAIAEGLIRLGRTGAAFSTEELLKKVRRTSPHIGRATVYRSIEKLAHMKVLDRIDFADGTHCYRLCARQSHHHHLACTKCHRVVDLDFCLQDEQIAAIEKRESFSIKDHAITLFGLCKGCSG